MTTDRMKTHISALLLILFSQLACVFAQSDSLRITGKFTGFADSTYLYLSTFSGDVSSTVDSARVVNNRFFISYHLPETPTHIRLMGPAYHPQLGFWADNVAVQIEGDRTDFAASRITGARWQEVEQKIKTAKQDPKALLEIISQHLDATPALEALFSLKEKIPAADLQAYHEQIPAAMHQSDFAKKIASYLAVQGLAVPQIGDALIDFEAVDPQGEKHTLAELNDRYVLLEFGSAFCGPCLFAIPELSRLQAEEAAQLRVISFSMDIRESAWRMGLEKAAQKGAHPDWLQLWDGEGDKGEIPLWYGVWGMPTFFLFDPEGNILEKWEGYLPGKITARWKEIAPAVGELPVKK